VVTYGNGVLIFILDQAEFIVVEVGSQPQRIALFLPEATSSHLTQSIASDLEWPVAQRQEEALESPLAATSHSTAETGP
jgi:hypothetical protein